MVKIARINRKTLAFFLFSTISISQLHNFRTSEVVALDACHISALQSLNLYERMADNRPADFGDRIFVGIFGLFNLGVRLFQLLTSFAPMKKDR
jgi:hypothetical protein